MELKSVFINGAGRLRSGWRLAVFVLVYIIFLFLLTSAVRVVYATLIYFAPVVRSGFYVQEVVYRLIILTSSLGAGCVCARILEGLHWPSLGLSLHVGWFRHLLVGSAIGIASIALAAAIATAGGGLRFTLTTAGIFPQIAKTLVLSGVLFIVAALAEEALFRGYPLQTLTRARLAVLGILLTSVPFAAVHLQNPNVAQGFTFVNTALAGVWLATAYLRTRSLWLPLGVHWAWNWALGSLFGLPVSGITRIAPHPVLQGTDLGPAWLTGGSYGIEGGLACTITLVISTVFIWQMRLVSATDELKRLSSQENPKHGQAERPLVITENVHLHAGQQHDC
ncbi:MAG: CPBP family intramembrane metalloprotease [Pyrinomonadaceae bacterium]|nr:CPBP family intramembrane metalloprotease [Pyrinomonadaceae bacterium]